MLYEHKLNYSDICTLHNKEANLYCPKCRKYTCEDCKEDHNIFFTPGQIRGWAKRNALISHKQQQPNLSTLSDNIYKQINTLAHQNYEQSENMMTNYHPKYDNEEEKRLFDEMEAYHIRHEECLELLNIDYSPSPETDEILKLGFSIDYMSIKVDFLKQALQNKDSLSKLEALLSIKNKI